MEAPVIENEGGEFRNRIEGTLLSCAPDWTVPAYVLMHPTEDGDLPDPFDYENWGYICAPFWDDARSTPVYTCQGGADTMRIGAEGLVYGMRHGADDTPWYRHRRNGGDGRPRPARWRLHGRRHLDGRL